MIFVVLRRVAAFALAWAAFAAWVAFAACSAVAAPAVEPACPAPDTLGVARTITVGGEARVGLKTYPQTLDLHDHEVVLTFDDGPSPRTTPQILDTLAAECVKADFFLIGRSAASAPWLVRREIAEGHIVGHHTWSHPAVTLRGLSEAAALADIDRGMAADDKAAYGAARGTPRVPFFRFPGFADTKPLLDDLTTRRVAVFSTDIWASDWVPMTPEAELDRLMSRLEKAGRGIILLHDTKVQTAQMLPRFLAALKAGGYRVVRVVPGPGPTPLRAAPVGWTSETEGILAHAWPKRPVHDTLPVLAPEERPAVQSGADGATPGEEAPMPAATGQTGAPESLPGLRGAEP